jgi:pimeloyl-ACP methyl ester carboxylesterase
MLLLLHGALGSSAKFQKLIELLPDFEVLTLNFSGHAGSKIPDQPFSFRLFGDDVISFLNVKQIDRVNIFGYSMGGYAALWLARHFPGRVGKIVTLATKMDWNEQSAQREAAMLNPDKMEEKIPAFVKMLAEVHGPGNWKELVKKTAGMMIDLGIEHLTEEDFKLINHQVLICVGEKDTMVSIAESKEVASLMKNGKFQVLPDTIHPFEKVNQVLVADQIREFIK